MNKPTIEVSHRSNERFWKIENSTVELLRLYQKQLQGIVDAYSDAGFSASFLTRGKLQQLISNPNAFLNSEKELLASYVVRVKNFSGLIQTVNAFNEQFKYFGKRFDDAQVDFNLVASPLNDDLEEEDEEY